MTRDAGLDAQGVFDVRHFRGDVRIGGWQVEYSAENFDGFFVPTFLEQPSWTQISSDFA